MTTVDPQIEVIEQSCRAFKRLHSRICIDDGIYIKETSSYIVTEWMFLYSDGEIETVRQKVKK